MERHELALVMPVYNEEGCIAAVVKSWHDRLEALGIHFVMIIVNDGSTDGTADILDGFSQDDCIAVIHQDNQGHGPAILRGYCQAVQSADWVFQCDSDNEMSPNSFCELWARRQQYDAVLGFRQNRRQSLSRGIITRCSRLAVRLIFGRSVEDANTPYRLMRSPMLRSMLEYIPPDAFAPNVIISGTLASCGAKIGSIPVPTQPRRTGRVSIVGWRLWKGAFRSLWQTLVCGRPIRRRLQIQTDLPTPELRPPAPGPLRIEAYPNPARMPARKDIAVSASLDAKVTSKPGE